MIWIGILIGILFCAAIWVSAYLDQPSQSTQPIKHSTGQVLKDVDLGNAFAVSDTEPWWRAVHQVIDAAEKEALDGARTQVANERMCNNSLGMADGAALVRSKMNLLRVEALKSREANQESGKTGT